MKRPHFNTIIFLLSFLSLKGQAQSGISYEYAPSEVVTIYSSVLKEERKVYIHCPRLDSSDLNERLSVIYLLDGENHFELLSQYADYLSRADVSTIPKVIIVGIPNTTRVRDLTPSNSNLDYNGKPDTSAWFKPSGGNEKFFEFIKAELMPMIDQKYKTQPYKIFGGHSFGGITTINCLLTQPDMFDAYIAVSPSFWWDNEYILKLSEKKLQSGAPLSKKLFYSNGEEGGPNSFFHNGLLKFNSILNDKRLIGLDHKYSYYHNESHMTVPIIAYLDALRFIFKQEEK